MASGPITSWEIDGETVETVADFISGGSKITADGDCSHEIKRRLLLGRIVATCRLLIKWLLLLQGTCSRASVVVACGLRSYGTFFGCLSAQCSPWQFSISQTWFKARLLACQMDANKIPCLLNSLDAAVSSLLLHGVEYPSLFR